jgi:hypothetical protein
MIWYCHRFFIFHYSPCTLLDIYKLLKTSSRRLLMRWASHSWRRVPKTPSTWSRPSWLWLHPSRIGTANVPSGKCDIAIVKFYWALTKSYLLLFSGWPANQPRPTLGQRPCRSAGNPSTRRRLAARPKIASFLWFLVTISTVCARTQMYLHYSW